MFGNIFKPKDLWSAAKSGNTKAIEELVAGGQEVNARKVGFVREGWTPLHLAVLHEQKEAIRLLVTLGADVNAKNKEAETPLWIAISELKKPDIAELLLDLGAKINARRGDLGMTPLDWAAFDGKSEMVEVLLKRGANPNAGRGTTRSAPIQQCANNGNVQILKALLKAGADVNTTQAGDSALGTAAVFGHEEFVKTLLEAGANPNQADGSGTTPLHSAVAGKKLTIVKMMVEAGVKLNAVRFGGRVETALDFAEWMNKKDTREIAEYLLGVGAKRASELPASETTPSPEKTEGTFWQLKDDSVLEATLVPWPPKPGQTKLKVELSPNGHDPDVSFVGTLDYRVIASEENNESWTPMKRGRKDEENNVHFSDSVTLTAGTVFVQFKVHPKWDDEPTILKDWKIQVES
jgi:ankyrin repeat protein